MAENGKKEMKKSALYQFLDDYRGILPLFCLCVGIAIQQAYLGINTAPCFGFLAACFGFLFGVMLYFAVGRALNKSLK